MKFDTQATNTFYSNIPSFFSGINQFGSTEFEHKEHAQLKGSTRNDMSGRSDTINPFQSIAVLIYPSNRKKPAGIVYLSILDHRKCSARSMQSTNTFPLPPNRSHNRAQTFSIIKPG